MRKSGCVTFKDEEYSNLESCMDVSGHAYKTTFIAIINR